MMYGITSPDLVINICAPGPITLFLINIALNPVAFRIMTPETLTGSNSTTGFINPSFDKFQLTFVTTEPKEHV